MTNSWRSATFRSRMSGDDPDETTQNATLAPPSPTPADGVQRNRPRLVVVSGPNVGSIHRIGDGVLLGRDPSATVFVDSPDVSRRHARIRATGEGFVLEDLGSRNGTYLNGKPIEQPTALAEGDKISVGTSVFRFAFFDEFDEQYHQRMYDSSLRDPLTRAFNRKYFDERLEAEIAFSLRHGTAVSLVVFDVDHFKHINDTHGHVVGDQVLMQLVEHVQRVIRTEDVLARYGGEEFVVLSRGIREDDALAFAERLRNAVERRVFLHTPPEGSPVRIPVTVSCGVAGMPAPDIQRGHELVDRADRALYVAKRAGRNRVQRGSGHVPAISSAPGRR